MDYEGIVNTTQKHMMKHWNKTKVTRHEELSRHKKCISEACRGYEEQKINFSHNENIKDQLIELAGKI